MSIPISINGVVYNYPEDGDVGWGGSTTNAFLALAATSLQKTAGNFFLTANVDFGATYGLVSQYFTSRTANSSTAGALRLANVDDIGWRNAANSANLLLTADADDLLDFDGVQLVNLSATQTLTNKTITGAVFNGDIGAIDALSTTGIATRIASETWATRTTVAPATGITITNPDGVTGDITFALANDLAAVEGMATVGMVSRTATDTWIARTITAPAAGISISAGDGIAGNPTLSLTNDLSALEGLTTAGVAIRTGADTWATRTTVAPAAGISITNPAGIAGDITLALANDLAGVEGLSTTGIAIRSAADTWLTRTLTGTANQITIGGGDGVAGNPTIAIATDVVLPGTGSLTVSIGTTAERPGSPLSGAVRYNTTTSKFEAYEAGAWANMISPGAALTGAQYVTLATDATLTAERVLTAGNSITITDAGANSTVTVNTIQDIRTTASPTFASPAGATAAPGTNTTQLATTAFVTTADNLKANITYVDTADNLKANLASPTFTGTPAAPTAAAATSTTQLATTAFATTADNLKANLASPTFTGSPAAPTATAGDNTTQLATTAYVQGEVVKSGRILKTIFATDAGGGTTSTTLVNLNAGNINITPASTASTLIIEVQFDGYMGPGAGLNNTANFRIYEGATPIGATYILGCSSGAGGQGSEAPCFVRCFITNSALTSRAFTLYGKTSSAASNAGAINMTWVIHEVKT